MKTEIEAKIKLTEYQVLVAKNIIMAKLKKDGIRPDLAEYFEQNLFYDRKGRLRRRGKSLRIRINTNIRSQTVSHVFTYKGKLKKGKFKQRSEYEVVFNYSDATGLQNILNGIGYKQIFAFSKIRTECNIDNVTVCFDELPLIGHFVEIEGKTEKAINKMVALLELSDQPIIKKSYFELLKKYVRKNPNIKGKREIYFPRQKVEALNL